MQMIFSLALMATSALGSVTGAYDLEYEIQSEFGDASSCDYVSQGIFLVWWDNSNDLTQEANILLDSMAVYRDACLGSLKMQDPPNPQDGFFFNVYLHEPGDVFPDGWACGVGTDCYGYPYMTLPIGILEDWITISHESFHVFQYSCDSPGFEGVDIFWYIEASANWFAAITYPESENAFMEAMTLVKVPHVSMWLGYDNFPQYYPDNWQRYCHQYAMALFLYYLTEIEGMPHSLICDGFYNGGSFPQDLNPQEFLFEAECVGDLRTHFMNWAARMTNGFDFILPSQLETAEYHWNTYADPEDDNQFTVIFDELSPYGWYSPPDSLATTAWSFNTYKVLNSGYGGYSFILQGSEEGTMGDPSLFRGKVVIQNAFSGARFYDLEMESDVLGSLTVDVSAADTALYFIVGSLPEVFAGSEQVFPYTICVEPTLTGVESHPGELVFESCAPNPLSHGTSVRFSIPAGGDVSLNVYDLAGHLVASVIDRQFTAGTHQLYWEGRASSGDLLPSGLYVMRLQHSGASSDQRLTILR